MKNKFLKCVFAVLGLIIFGTEAWAEGKIVYSGLRDGYWQVCSISIEGKENEQLTFLPFDKRDPVSLDNREIIFRDNNGRLHSLNMESKKEQEVLGQFNNAQGVHFSPALQKVVFVSLTLSQPEMSEIWISDTDGNNAQQLTQDRQFKYQPTFSPKGDRIAFVKASPDRKAYNIWIINTDGSGEKQVTFGDSRDSYPQFSKDEEFMVFSSNRNEGDYDLYVAILDSGEIRTLVQSPGLETSPRFSPDGKKIVFVSSRSGSQQIWVVDQDGQNLRQLTQEPGESVDPDWQ